MVEFKRAPQLPDEVLAKRESLPEKPAPVTLRGERVTLQPLDVARDAEALYRVSNGEAVSLGERSIDAYDAEKVIWRYMSYGAFESVDALGATLQDLVDVPNALCLCVYDVTTNHPIGIANLMSNVPQHLKVELGNIWYSPLVQGTRANTEATYLMLDHAFSIGYRRVEWKCDALNQRSRKAALRLGFQFEGIQESHYIIKGRNRDTAWFRILDREWADVKARFPL